MAQRQQLMNNSKLYIIMKLEKLTEDQIKALSLTDKEQKSNEAFAKVGIDYQIL